MTNFSINNRNLSKIPKHVKVPAYDRKTITTGIVHVGVGGFHRSHQACYVDELLHDKNNKHWGICGVSLLESDYKIYNTLKNQDGLYTLIVKELDGSFTFKVVGSIVAYLFAPDNPDLVIEKMADSATKIITLTITEGGYNYNEAIREFDFDNPLIRYDLLNADTPKTIFGYLTQSLKRRKERGLLGCTIQSCDNIQSNGDFTKRMLLAFVRKAAPELVGWIEENVSFPNSMVDRITPVTLGIDIETLKNNTKIEDAWPVVSEPFKQWVIEDDFVSGRPAWEKVGAQFVKNVVPYEHMKLSLLNAGHSVLGVLGALLGYVTIDESINNPAIYTFLNLFMDREVTPNLGDLTGVDLEVYKNSLLQRFGNVYMKDQIERICSESSSKLPIFLLPTIKAQLKNSESIVFSVFVIAAWAIYSLGKDENQQVIGIKDVLKSILSQKAKEAQDNPAVFLEIESVFGDLKDSEVFIKEYIKAYRNIKKYGVEKAAQNLIREITQETSKNNIVCYGEVLWDFFPDQKKVGGAPLNVALRLQSFINDTHIITRIGKDKEGKEIITLINESGVNVSNVQVDSVLKTGDVIVGLDEKGTPSYSISSPRAWDFIELTEELKNLVKNADAFIFGSLITRHKVSRETLYELLNIAKFKVLDINLRAPFYTEEILLHLINEADFIKVNYKEVLKVAKLLQVDLGVFEENIKLIAQKTNTKSICVTKGSKGVVLYYNKVFYYNEGHKVSIKDSVGSGDSFLAALLDKLLKKEQPQKALDFASAVGALVAKNRGATPVIKDADIKMLMDK